MESRRRVRCGVRSREKVEGLRVEAGGEGEGGRREAVRQGVRIES